MYYLFLAIGLFYFIQYLDTHSAGQVLWDTIKLLVQLFFGVILIIVFLFWVGHKG